ncbi:UDP-glucose 4-epimerase family protein [Vibrio sp. SCSIO 43137]|uniref:UDP-glucose 4-epimerase family protein n=1 Tax=Vibrio sp. SCSIO 43137 TaxID=3021011 RepID=UPI002308360D|nr:SDR family oxidoreductase [Vibrio sp. SCSIO 43137]WCE29886.1 SDR family oxidoreductase [Vibrio sp. SCSIO 43137]
MAILITGSSGFVGQRLVAIACEKGIECKGVVRTSTNSAMKHESRYVTCSVGDISGITDWTVALQGVDTIVHCAAKVHQMNEQNQFEKYKEVNALGTLNLASQAAQKGVKRFVFLSTIKVNGEYSKPMKPFSNTIGNVPTEPYALSKYEAEIGLHKIAEETGLEVVIIRPPLVYGEGVKANFLSLMNLAHKGLPLPLGAINNKRSIVFRDNLIDLILLCCHSEKAKGQTFLVSDGEDISTTQLIRLIAEAMHKNALLFPVPNRLIELLTKAIGKPEIYQRVYGDLQLSISHTREVLEWEPPISMEEGIRRTVNAFLPSK